MQQRAYFHLVLLCPLLGCSAFPMAALPPEPHGEICLVDKRIWAGGGAITPSVVERLVEIDHYGKLVPRLATKWRWLDERTLELTLRQGVRFHNGEDFNTDIVKRNWDALVALRETRGADLIFWAFAPEARLEIRDPHTGPGHMRLCWLMSSGPKKTGVFLACQPL